MHVSMPARPHLVSMKKGFLGDSTCVGIFLGVRGEGGVPVQAPAEGDALQRLHVRVAVHAHLRPRAHKALKHPGGKHAIRVRTRHGACHASERMR